MEELRIDPSIMYDVVPLPSQGIHYENKKKSVRVAYLTAADENILMSPNLLQSDTVVNELLKRKVLDRDLDLEELVDEDKQAILLFLRNTAFGSEYKVKLNDPKTDKVFEAVLDVSVLKTKELNLVPDEKGEFEYYLPISKKTVKFKFLNKKQELELDKIRNGGGVVPINTKKLEFMIKSIDGDRNQMTIYQFIQIMPIKDSQDFKKFVDENKPGLDLIVETIATSGEKVPVYVDFGVEFFRPFYGI